MAIHLARLFPLIRGFEERRSSARVDASGRGGRTAPTPPPAKMPLEEVLKPLLTIFFNATLAVKR